MGVTPNPELVVLQRTVSELLEGAGLQPDRVQGYTPHVTLARLKTDGSLPALDTFLRDHADLERPPFTVDAITLYRSQCTASGAHYTPLGRFG